MNKANPKKILSELRKTKKPNASSADVFIVESLRPEDVKAGRVEGEFLSHILRLEGKDAQYKFVKNRKELSQAIERFQKSNYRYLHISCHGDDEGIELYDGTLPDLNEIELLLKNRIKDRRVFFSACGLVTEDLAKALLPGTGCYSVIGPETTLSFGQAAIFWASFYHLMLRRRRKLIDGKKRTVTAKSMRAPDIEKRVWQLSTLFKVRMKYYRWSDNSVGYVDKTAETK